MVDESSPLTGSGSQSEDSALVKLNTYLPSGTYLMYTTLVGSIFRAKETTVHHQALMLVALIFCAFVGT